MNMQLLNREILTDKNISEVIRAVRDGFKNQTLTYNSAMENLVLLNQLEPGNTKEIEDVIHLSNKLEEKIPLLEIEQKFMKPQHLDIENNVGWISFEDINKVRNMKRMSTIMPKGTLYSLLFTKKPEYDSQGDYRITKKTGNLLVVEPMINMERLEGRYEFFTQPEYIQKDNNGEIYIRGIAWTDSDKVEEAKNGNDLVTKIHNCIVFIRPTKFQEEWDGDISIRYLIDKKGHRWASGVKTVNEERQLVKNVYSRLLRA